MNGKEPNTRDIVQSWVCCAAILEHKFTVKATKHHFGESGSAQIEPNRPRARTASLRRQS